MSDIADNLEKVLLSIRQEEKKANRKEGSVHLMAVSKMHPASCVIEAFKAGQVLFGENRVQEARDKWNAFDGLFKEKPQLAIIGQLQKNKVKKAVEIAQSIHSVDRFELLEEIYLQAVKQNKKIEVFFELHTAEDTKSGFDPKDEALKTCLDFCSKQAKDIVIPKGFMTIAPNTKDEGLIRKSFVTTRNTRDEYQKQYQMLDLSDLSFGMSGDYKIAIQEGSTIVRIGTAIFGQREYQ